MCYPFFFPNARNFFYRVRGMNTKRVLTEWNKNTDDAWRHGVRSLVFGLRFPTEKRAWGLCMHGCHRANQMFWVQRLVGECLVDITSATDGQRQSFWTWPCRMRYSCLRMTHLRVSGASKNSTYLHLIARRELFYLALLKRVQRHSLERGEQMKSKR